MFESDPNRSELEKIYIKDCISTYVITQIGSKEDCKTLNRKQKRIRTPSKAKAVSPLKDPARSSTES